MIIKKDISKHTQPHSDKVLADVSGEGFFKVTVPLFIIEKPN